jgi:methionyl-tRNA formyltransferase
VGIKIVFMGSASFALPSLDALFAGHPIQCVVSQPDKPRGRGRIVQGPPVKQRANELHLPVYQPTSLKGSDAQELLGALAPDMIVVVAYGKLLPPWLLQLPKYGCVNVHASLLPKYRGAAPVHWAVANGEERTGVCTMLLDAGLDTGPVFLCEEASIGPDETAPELYQRLAAIGAPLLLKTVEGILAGSLKPEPQADSGATLAPMLKKEDGFLDWRRPAQEIHNRVRAFNPWPGTVTKFRGKTCKILKTRRVETELAEELPTVGSGLVSKGRFLVRCGDGLPLEILSIQPENRKAVSGADFANGVRIRPGEKFEPLVDNGQNVD